MKPDQTQELSADMRVWQEQTREKFREAIRDMHSRVKVPTGGWAIMAIVEIALKYAVLDKVPPEEGT